MIANFLHHLFYRIYWWNIKVIKDNGTPVYMTFLGTIFLFGININSMLFIYGLIVYGNTLTMPDSLYWGLVCSLIVFNLLFYLRNGTYRYITKKYIRKLEKKQIIKRDIAVAMYIILSFAVYILVIVLTGSANNV